MGKSNYTLTEEQKKQLDTFARLIIADLVVKSCDVMGGVLDLYDTPGDIFNDDKFRAIVQYIGEKLAAY